MPSPNLSDIVSAVESAMAECQRAMQLHPHWPSDPLHAVAILAEELGELTQKCLQATYEPKKGVTVADIHEEAVQVAAMGLRFLVNFDRYTFPAVKKELLPKGPGCDVCRGTGLMLKAASPGSFNVYGLEACPCCYKPAPVPMCWAPLPGGMRCKLPERHEGACNDS